jgi:hypothetical protein
MTWHSHFAPLPHAGGWISSSRMGNLRARELPEISNAHKCDLKISTRGLQRARMTQGFSWSEKWDVESNEPMHKLHRVAAACAEAALPSLEPDDSRCLDTRGTTPAMTIEFFKLASAERFDKHATASLASRLSWSYPISIPTRMSSRPVHGD